MILFLIGLLWFGETTGKFPNRLVFKPIQTFKHESFGRITLANEYNDVLYAIDKENHRVHRLDAVSGAYLGGFGRKGEGPGEFQFTGYPRLAYAHNQVIIFDGNLMHYFTADGQFLKRQNLPSQFGTVNRIIPLENGSFLMLVRTFISNRMNQDRVIVWDQEKDTVIELAELTGNFYEFERDCWTVKLNGDQFIFYAVDNGHTIAWGSTHNRVISLHDLDGSRKGQVRIPWEDYPMTDDERELQLEYAVSHKPKDQNCRKYSVAGEPVYRALIPFKSYWLVGQFHTWNGLFEVRVLDGQGKIVGSGSYLFGEQGNFAQGSSGDFFAKGMNEDGDWRIIRLALELEPQ